jgi:hypothetical protein
MTNYQGIKPKKKEIGREETILASPELQPGNFYQAVGIIAGVVDFHPEKGYQIEICGKKYRLYFKKKEIFKCIRENKEARLLVYPRFVHFPKRDEAAKLSFKVVAIESNRKEGLLGLLNDYEFLLRGIWQFIPVCQTPVITILQNYNADFKKRIAKLNKARKCKELKAIHCPLFWRDAIVNPFKYCKDSESQPDKYFVSVKARLDFNREAFIFDSLLGLPTTELPNGYRLSKKMKAEVRSAKSAK